MTKEEVQSRVSFNGKPLQLEDFDWNEKNRVFNSTVNGLMLDFKDVNGVTFTTGDNCTFITGNDCIFDTSWNCTFNTGSGCKFTTNNSCTFKTDWNCEFKTGNRCTFTTDDDCIFDTSWNCAFTTGSGCKFKTNNYCTFKTDWDCEFNTNYTCTFDTGWNCTFITGDKCAFNTYNDCTFKTGEQCVIIRRDIYEVISNKREIQLCPNGISGYLEKIDDTWYLNGDVSLGEHIIADKILSKIVSKKKLDSGTLYRVCNYTIKGMSSMPSYLIEIDGIYAHGSSIRDVKDSIMYKMVDRDTSAYTDMTLDTVYTIPEAIKMYRTITGACSAGVKMFVENTDNVPDTISVKDILDITSGQYGHETLKEYIDKTI